MNFYSISVKLMDSQSKELLIRHIQKNISYINCNTYLYTNVILIGNVVFLNVIWDLFLFTDLTEGKQYK